MFQAIERDRSEASQSSPDCLHSNRIDRLVAYFFSGKLETFLYSEGSGHSIQNFTSLLLFSPRMQITASLSFFTFLHWRRKWQLTPVFLPGESQGQGSLADCRLWGRTESTRLKRLSSSSRQQRWTPKCHALTRTLSSLSSRGHKVIHNWVQQRSCDLRSLSGVSDRVKHFSGVSQRLKFKNYWTSSLWRPLSH